MQGQDRVQRHPGEACNCGLAYPNKMWFMPNPNKWKWKCEVVWEPLVAEAKKYPDFAMLQEWVAIMTKKHGDDCCKWPKIGCTANFVPWKKGPSMVMELKTKSGEWSSFMSARLPQELDDAIKAKHAAFYLAQKNITADDLLESLPICFPMTHIVDGFPGVARYPVDEWERSGAPYFSEKSWCKLCMKIAANDLANLQSVMDVAEKVSAKHPVQEGLFAYDTQPPPPLGVPPP